MEFGCHPERSEGPLQFQNQANTEVLRFAQDDNIGFVRSLLGARASSPHLAYEEAGWKPALPGGGRLAVPCAWDEKIRLGTEEVAPSLRCRPGHGLQRVSFRADESLVSRLGLQ